MSAVRERVYERWLAAGDDRTLDEWIAYRRACAIQQRQRAVLSSAVVELTKDGQMRHFPALAQLQYQAAIQGASRLGQMLGLARELAAGLLGGGLFSRAFPRDK